MISWNEFMGSDIQKRLEIIESMGIDIFVDGQPIHGERAVHKYVKEEQNYMADYIMDDFGELQQVRYDKIISE